jgi:hypothetical protein
LAHGFASRLHGRGIPHWTTRSIEWQHRISFKRVLLLVFAMLIGAYIVSSAARVYVRKYYIFLPDYVRWVVTPATAHAGSTHVFVLMTDHFEPDYDARRAAHWADGYVALAARHRDRSGRPPQHTWFYPGEQEEPDVMRVLARLTSMGLGEVELHFHHDYDTAETLRPKLVDAIATFQQYGFLKTIDGRTRFAFIHGNSGLDDGDGPLMCGVKTELRLLHELGCYADFSFPSIYLDSQPPSVNTIYAARDDDGPKSYAKVWPLRDLTAGSADLMIFQGPLIFAPSLTIRHLFLDLDDGNIHPTVPASPTRVDRWIRANVHVKERPDWIFVKLFAHGVSSPEDEEETVGPHFDAMLTYLERQYNDGTHYVLHYVTAREAYNLAMAASTGASGEPEMYLDRGIPRYAADPRNPAPIRALGQ